MSAGQPAMWLVHEPGRPRPYGVRWRDKATGKKKAAFFATEKDAKAFRTATLDLVVEGVQPATCQVGDTPLPGTMADYLTTWLRDIVKPHRDDATYASYEYLCRLYLVKHLGAVPLADVTMATVRQMYKDLHAAGKSLSTRKHVHAALSSAMGQAVLDEAIAFNPCAKLGRTLRHKEETAVDPEPNPMRRDEAAAFLARIASHEPEWLPYFTFLHDTGVRVGEAAAVKWENIDWKGRRAKIEGSYSPLARKDKDPKTHQRRYIDLTDLVLDRLAALRPAQRKDSLRAGRKVPIHVFTNRNGSPRRQDGNMRRVFNRTCVAVGLVKPVKGKKRAMPTPRHTPHDIRDTFATIHLTDDYGRLPWVSRQLGHETERTTIEHYFKYLPTALSAGFANKIRATG